MFAAAGENGGQASQYASGAVCGLLGNEPGEMLLGQGAESCRIDARGHRVEPGVGDQRLAGQGCRDCGDGGDGGENTGIVKDRKGDSRSGAKKA